MENQLLNSNNIDAYHEFDFRELTADDEIEIAEQDTGLFPLCYIKQREGMLNFRIIFEVSHSLYLLQDFTNDRFKSAFERSFGGLRIEGISEVVFNEFSEDHSDSAVLLCWYIKFPAVRSNKEIKDKN